MPVLAAICWQLAHDVCRVLRLMHQSSQRSLRHVLIPNCITS